MGCEFWLFVPGIVPGADVLERIENLQNGTYDPVDMQRKLDEFTARAAAVGRSVFRGELSYAAAEHDEVDWTLFDIVGIDYYGYHERPAGYRRDLRTYRRFGKPLSISEFVTPGSWHWPGDPVHDLDTVSYAIVKPVQDTPGDPESPWHWEPKEAYRALASRYGRAARGKP